MLLLQRELLSESTRVRKLRVGGMDRNWILSSWELNRVTNNVT